MFVERGHPAQTTISPISSAEAKQRRKYWVVSIGQTDPDRFSAPNTFTVDATSNLGFTSAKHRRFISLSIFSYQNQFGVGC